MRKKLYTKADVVDLGEIEDVTGMVIVLSPEHLLEEYRKPEYQLWIATGGFGTKNFTLGRALFAKCLADGENVRFDRSDFMGVLKDELLPDAEELVGQNLPTVLDVVKSRVKAPERPERGRGMTEPQGKRPEITPMVEPDGRRCV